MDAVVVGGGITGATAAYLLQDEGLSVALVERDRCGHGDTSHTSAHLTAITDVTLPQLIQQYGDAHAEAIWEGGFAALHHIAEIAGHNEIACGLRWVPGYLCASFNDTPLSDLPTLSRIRDEAVRLGFDAELLESVPGPDTPAVRFDHQLRLRPMEYLAGLLDGFTKRGGLVFEHTAVTTIDDEPIVVRCDTGAIHTSFVVIATHVPILGKASLVKGTLLQTDLYPYSSYVISARIDKDRWPDALMWDSSDPYYFVRLDPRDDHDVLVVGGCDHKTGQIDEEAQPFMTLAGLLDRWDLDAEITHQWSGQVVETRDHLPYIGEIAPGQFVITGFGGNGITFGTLGAIMARDHALERTNPWSGLFDVNRTRLTKGLWDYVRENVDYPYYLIRDRFKGTEGRDIRAVRRGEGAIIDLRGERVAAYRDQSGTLHVLSPVCPHMGCLVAWNSADTTWDCPCHGSRFAPTGRLLRGPAEQDLRPTVGTHRTTLGSRLP